MLQKLSHAQLCAIFLDHPVGLTVCQYKPKLSNCHYFNNIQYKRRTLTSHKGRQNSQPIS